MKLLIARINTMAMNLASTAGFPDERIDVVYRASTGEWSIERRNVRTGHVTAIPMKNEAGAHAFLQAHAANLNKLMKRELEPVS
jgi:hypothetical protein